MNITRLFTAVLLLAFVLVSCSDKGIEKITYVSVKTTLGDFKLKLYNETPLHRDNFIRLVNSGYYDGISFHRVIKGFMVQAGDYSTKKGASPAIADSTGNLKISPEFVPGLIHKRGALAAAREDNSVNPEMNSSATQFYIVQASALNSSELALNEEERDRNIKQGEFIRVYMHLSDSCKKAGAGLTDSEIQEKALLRLYDMPDKTDLFKTTQMTRETYMNVGGVPRLDGTYTVFGEVAEGMDIIDKIASVATGPDDVPAEKVEILKMKIVKK